MKKSLLLLSLIMLICIVALSACDSEKNQPSSNGTEQSTQQQPDENHLTENIVFECQHNEIIDLAIDPTCKSSGLTEGSHCSICNKIIVEQETILISDVHSPITDPAISATCKNIGLTEGSHCSICNKIIVEQETVPISDVHSPITDPAISATCKNTGLTEGSHCKICNKIIVEQETVPISDIHSPITDPAISATCKNTGLTEGSHCKICNEIFVVQKVIPTIDHSFIDNKCETCNTYIPSNGLQLEYDSAHNNYIVLGIGTCTDKRIVIPPEKDGIPVTEIARNAFKDTSSFYEIVIPNSIVTMKSGAFKNCSVESVILSDSLEIIPNDCFNNCTKLKSITFPQNLYSIGEYAFYNCKNLSPTIVFPERLQYIKAYAFTNCTSIKKMFFSDRLIKISHDAFTNVKFEQIKYDGTSYRWKDIVETGWCSNYQNYLLICINGTF